MVNRETAVEEIVKILENFPRDVQFDILDGLLDNYSDEIRENVDKKLTEMGINLEELISGIMK